MTSPLIHRREMIAGLALPLIGAPAILCAAAPEAPVVTTAQGKLRGIADEGLLQFRGIPYGGSVSGPEHRFRAPTPPPRWTGVRDATRFGAPSIQKPRPDFGNGEPPAAEDCLFLNVWTPAIDGRKRPVMVYQHGGGFVIGSGASPWQDGSELARKYDVVVVQSNHRLGALGYLYLGDLLGSEYTANAGMQDIVAALAWVKTNIAAFGGDPGNVMIFGESGGGGKTAALYAMPGAAPYFHKASIESAINPGVPSRAAATEITREMMRRIGITDPRALLTIPAATLLKAQLGDAPPGGPGMSQPDKPAATRPEMMFWPVVDGTTLPELPFGAHAPTVSANKPLMAGSCKDEAVFFYQGDKAAFSLDEAGLRSRLDKMLGATAPAWLAAFKASRPTATPSQLLMAIATAKPWRTTAIKIAEMKAKQATAPVYAYLLDYPSPQKVPGTDYAEGSPHASDIPMKFDNAAKFGPKAPDRLKTADNMSEMWATFARTSRPAAEGQPDWQPYTLSRRETMVIDARCRLVDDPESAERRFLATQADAEAI